MKILFLTDNFPPETNAPSTRTYEHCLTWVKMGYDITVITCFPNFPTGKVYEGYTNKLYQKESVEGISVIRVWSYITKNDGFFKRIVDYSSYALTSFLAGLFVKTDLIIATSPQFFTAICGRMLSFCKQKPWVMEVRDLWPDSIAAVGSMNKKTQIFRLLKKIEHHLYLSASKIIVVTDSFKRYIIDEHSIAKEKIGVFKNGVITNKFKTPGSSNVESLKKELGLEEKVIISYIGTHGLAHGLKFILRSAAKITTQKVHFLFIGDGAEKEKLIEYSNALKLNNVSFLNSITKSEVPSFIELSDYSLVNLKKADEFRHVIPSKIFENVAMFKPILLGVEGEAKKLIEDYQVGVCFEPENTKSFINAISKIECLDFKYFKKNCNRMLRDFNRDKIAEDLIKYLKNE